MTPLKFHPIICPKVWGSESWLISGYGDQVSVVENGRLAGNDLNDLLEIYMDELVGEKVYRRFGNYFPLLIKIIHAEDDLSIQVHPDDEEAGAMNQLGKDEIWYVMDVQKGAQVVSGFVRDTSSVEVEKMAADGSLANLLHYQTVDKGDVVWIPAGRVHSLCKGTMVAEIQESSDITYRLYDYNRPDSNGNLRPLHIKEALNVLDFEAEENPVQHPQCKENTSVSIIDDIHFSTNLIRMSSSIERDFSLVDSFVIYLCVEGSADIVALDADDTTPVHIQKGEAVLIPASLDDIRLIPTSGETRLIETYLGRN